VSSKQTNRELSLPLALLLWMLGMLLLWASAVMLMGWLI
jgi:hypothetical protein